MKIIWSLAPICHESSPRSENTNLTGSTTVLLTFCLFCLDSAPSLMLNEHQISKPSDQSVGGQSSSDISSDGESFQTRQTKSSIRWVNPEMNEP